MTDTKRLACVEFDKNGEHITVRELPEQILLLREENERLRRLLLELELRKPREWKRGDRVADLKLHGPGVYITSDAVFDFIYCNNGVCLARRGDISPRSGPHLVVDSHYEMLTGTESRPTE